MIKSLFTFCFLLCTIAGWGQKTKMTFEAVGGEIVGEPYVVLGQKKVASQIGARATTREVTLDIDMPAYVSVYFSKYDSRLCYVEPGKTLTLKYDPSQGSKTLSFEGSLAMENQYLLRHKWTEARPASLPATFAEWEKKREEVFRLERYLHQPVKDTITFINYARENFIKDGTWLRIPDYMRLLDQYIRNLVRFNVGPKRQLEGEELADKRVELILANINQPDITGYLIDITLYYLGEMNIPRYNDLYHRYVKDPERISLYEQATRKAMAMAPGQPCPDFTFNDYEGGKVSLADLRGKYVYIDLWATWCGPCKGEMPSLLELEKRFEGKDILFVSISVDNNKNISLWKKNITQMGLKGIQLHLGEKWDWLKTFMPSSISVPRFILLDREGRIVDAHAPRPSDPRTAKIIETLLNGSSLNAATGSTSGGITFFEGTYEEALAKAKAERRLIFLDCYADWCAPCLKMAKEVFTIKRVGDYFNEHFISLKCNMEKDDAGRALRDRFNVVSYPTLLFVTPEGFVASRRQGYTIEDSLLAFARRSLEEGGKSDERLFAEGCRESEFLKGYVKSLCGFHQADAVENVLEILYTEQGDGLLADKDYWAAYVMCAKNTDSPLCEGFTRSYSALCQTHGQYAVDQKVRNLFASFAAVLKLYDTDNHRERLNESRLKFYLTSLAKRKLPEYKLLQQEVEYLIKLKEKDYQGAYSMGQKYLKKTDARTLCNWAAWGERMVRGDQTLRTRIAEWADRAIASANGNQAIVEECNNVKRDLLASPNPVISFKGKNARTTIPIRGY